MRIKTVNQRYFDVSEPSSLKVVKAYRRKYQALSDLLDANPRLLLVLAHQDWANLLSHHRTVKAPLKIIKHYNQPQYRQNARIFCKISRLTVWPLFAAFPYIEKDCCAPIFSHLCPNGASDTLTTHKKTMEK